MSRAVQEFESRCREAIRGLRFFDKPVEEMDAESLLVFAGYLAMECSRLRDVADKAEAERVRSLIESLAPRKAERWIPVADRRPGAGSVVLGWRSPWYCAAEVSMASAGTWWFSAGEKDAGPISHWMPLPSPPKESK